MCLSLCGHPLICQDSDKVRLLAALIKSGRIKEKGQKESAQMKAARAVLEEKGMKNSGAVVGRVEAREKQFVADKPVQDPKHFTCLVKGSKSILIGYVGALSFSIFTLLQAK